MQTTPDRLQTIRQAVAGDTTAMKLLLSQPRGRLLRLLRLKIPGDLRATIDADDVLQETYFRVFTHIRSFVPSDETCFDRWVTTIALHRLQSAIRDQRRARRSGTHSGPPAGWPSFEDSVVGVLDRLAAPQQTPSRSVARGEAIASMNHAISALPAHYRRAIELVYLEGRTVAATAHEMGRTSRSIHGLCRRATRLLAQRLTPVSAYWNPTD